MELKDIVYLILFILSCICAVIFSGIAFKQKFLSAERYVDESISAAMISSYIAVVTGIFVIFVLN